MASELKLIAANGNYLDRAVWAFDCSIGLHEQLSHSIVSHEQLPTWAENEHEIVVVHLGIFKKLYGLENYLECDLT